MRVFRPQDTYVQFSRVIAPSSGVTNYQLSDVIEDVRCTALELHAAAGVPPTKIEYTYKVTAGIFALCMPSINIDVQSLARI